MIRHAWMGLKLIHEQMIKALQVTDLHSQGHKEPSLKRSMQ